MQTFADPLSRAVQIAGDHTAVISEGRHFTFRELDSRCRRLAAVLKSKGAEPGDRIAVLAANTNHHLESYVAIPAAGFVIVPLNTRHAGPELEYAIKDAEVKILLSDRDPGALRELVDTVVMIPDEYDALLESANEVELGVGITEDTLAGLFYTGGTTGASKGVMLTHRNLISNTFHFMTMAPPAANSVFLVMAPMFHAAGSNGILGGIWTGGCQIPLKLFDPAIALDLIEKHKVTHTLGVPTMLAAIAELQHKEPRDTSSLTMVAHGGSPIATEVVRRAAEAFPSAEFVHVYGMTEASPLVTGLRNEQDLLDVDRSRSCGQSLIGVQVKIIDSAGNELPTGEVGELAARGPNIMKGYWNKPEQTAEVLVDGWYRSGDMGYMDDEGFVFLVDRAKDMIVSGGENVYCSEVEEALYKHPAVLEAAVFGVPDEAWGEAVHAVVVPRGKITSEELIVFCRTQIAGYKLPKAITLSDEELPKSGPGKILKRELREPFWKGHNRKVN
ncbi:MAG: long-chain-fatty-acid--CoA ligase [Woeseiaceae bacterium]